MSALVALGMILTVCLCFLTFFKLHILVKAYNLELIFLRNSSSIHVDLRFSSTLQKDLKFSQCLDINK